MSNPNGTQAVDRAARLLSEVVHAPDPVTFTELTAVTGLAKSTTSRLMPIPAGRRPTPGPLIWRSRAAAPMALLPGVCSTACWRMSVSSSKASAPPALGR